MAQTHKAPKQPQDPYAQRSKSLTSTVQRLRGWVGSDPSRAPELADALVELTEHRLLGHGYAAAAADAQESVRLAAQLLSASGPIGPYASLVDATRCVTALVHVATVQSGIGRPESAGQTMRSVQDLQQQLRDVGLREQPSATTQVWAQLSTARAALASADVASAVAAADAALTRVVDAGLRDQPDAAYLAMDADWLVSDCRWAAGRADEALTPLHLAKDRYDELVAGRLADPSRLSPALVERLAEPLFGLYRDLADRLIGTGEVDLALAVRRTLVDLLEGLAVRLGDPVRTQLAMALADLATDLLTAERVDEAGSTAARAAAAAAKLTGPTTPRLLVAAALVRALTHAGQGTEALAMVRPLVSAEGSPSAALAVTLFATADALRAEGDEEAEAATRRRADAMARELLGESGSSTALSDLARGVVSRGTQSPDQAADHREKQREAAAWLEAERAEAHRLEVARMEQARAEAERREAERAAAERAATERLAAERAEAERVARLEAERQAAAEEAERVERKRRREERLEEHQREAERLEAERQEAERLEVERLAAERAAAEPDELVVAQQEWLDAKDRGDRRAARAANERVVELLRPHAQANPAEYGPQLRAALEDLSSARLRAGDLFGSRSAAREARALGRTMDG